MFIFLLYKAHACYIMGMHAIDVQTCQPHTLLLAFTGCLHRALDAAVAKPISVYPSQSVGQNGVA